MVYEQAPDVERATLTWTWDDPASAPSPDQDGVVTYAAGAAPAGTFTDHLPDGTTRTCSFTQGADGAAIVSGCP